MSQILNIAAANNKGVLWPPISDTLDTYLRRRHSDADTYEKVWRLIHVWESVAITLGVTSMARVRQSDELKELWRRQRELFHGKSWDAMAGAMKSGKGAADGSIDQWIKILGEIAKSDHFESRFLTSLKNFLNVELIDMGSLTTSWAKACDVPEEFKPGKVKVTQALRTVNSFRNRFAHVPFPHDPLAEVYEALEVATEQLFSIPPPPSSHEKAGESNPLTGAIFYKGCYFHGNHVDSLDGPSSSSIEFRFPCQQRQTEKAETWPAQVFIHIDAMMRPHVLTRVNRPHKCEYTRFRAEANAVLSLDDASLTAVAPEPIKAEYLGIEEEAIDSEVVVERQPTLEDAKDAIRSEDFEAAINICEQLTRSRPTYHSAWLRLGYARREKAVRLPEDRKEEAIRLFEEALQDLNRAAQHKSPESKALAYYELSKVHYQIYYLDNSNIAAIKLSYKEAEKACSLSNEARYQSWLEYIRRQKSRFDVPSRQDEELPINH